MALNHPYNPRHNPKIYIPKLTEEERRARATPLENLRGLRFRTQTPAEPSPAEAVVSSPVPMPIAPATPSQPKAAVPSPTQIAPAAPSPSKAAAPVPSPLQNTLRLPHVPTAREVVFAEFPEIFAHPIKRAFGEARVDEYHLVGARCLADAHGSEHPRYDEIDARSQYLALFDARPGQFRQKRAFANAPPRVKGRSAHAGATRRATPRILSPESHPPPTSTNPQNFRGGCSKEKSAMHAPEGYVHGAY